MSSPQARPGNAALDRALGILLFLPVPLVLWLFTRAPLGVVPSLALGMVIMLSHRLYARSFALSRADRRCLWCGGAAGGPRLEVEEPLGATRWRACTQDHARSAGAVLAWAQARALFLRAGILGTLGLFLVLGLLAGLRRLGPIEFADMAALFRFGVAISVLPLGFLWPAVPAAAERPRVPFPLHIQALVGTWAVLWLFRLVGLYWLGAAFLHLARRLGLLVS